MKRASSTQRGSEVFGRPGGGLGEPGPSGSPISTAEARALVVTTLHQLIDTLIQLPSSGSPGQQAESTGLPLLLDAAEAAKVLSLSRGKVCDLAARGEIPSIRVGRALRIPRDRLLEWIENRTSIASSQGPVRLPAWAHVNRSQEL
jgi:excisionase family DNA binding protein